ncbi:MAG: hypothetical protein ABSE58_12505 [Candidatus Limnocylindrales bacterium]|jgi:hypothetical protein
MIQDRGDQQLIGVALASEAPAKLDAKELEKPTAEELEVTRPQREASAGRVRPCAESGR